MFRHFRILICMLAIAGKGRAQQATPPPVIALPPSLSVAGTGVAVNGAAWGYVVWQATSPEWYLKHDVAVYLKPGNADSASPFVLQGTMARLTDPAAINSWIARSQRLIDATAGLAENHEICSTNAESLIRQWSPIPDPIVPGDFAARLSILGNRANQEPGAAAALRTLGQNHPIFRFVTGTGWTGPLGVPPGQDATIELREIVRATGVEGTVVGRVTVKAGSQDPRVSPDLVTAPGPAVQVTPNWPITVPAIESPFLIPPPTPLPDLSPALRWSISEEMRRQILLTRGFMVWRGNTATSFPTAIQLLQTIPSLKKILRNPAPASKIFSSIEGIGSGPVVNNFTLDRTTWFIADDNERYKFSVVPADRQDTVFTGSPLAWNGGYYYHVAAADLLGRYGPPAPVRQATAVYTLPPMVPKINRIENVVDSGQRLRLAIQPNENLPGQPPTARYLIFRDRVKNTLAAAGSLNQSIDPTRQNEMVYVGTASQPANTSSEFFFTDFSLVPTLPEHYGQTYFYCVRAVHDTPFGMNISPPSPAVFGTVRDRVGPPAPIGSIFTESPRAGINLVTTSLNPVPNPKLPPNTTKLRFLIDRLDPGVSHVLVSITSGLPGEPNTIPAQERVLPAVYFGKANGLVFEYPIRNDRIDSLGVKLRPVTSEGRPGKNYAFSIAVDQLADRSDIPFSFQVKSAGLMQMDPVNLGFWFNHFHRPDNSSSVYPFVPVFTSGGTWNCTFPGPADFTKSRSLLIQAKNLFSATWVNFATARLPLGSTQFHFYTNSILVNNEYRVWEVLDPADDPLQPQPQHKPLIGVPPVIAKLHISVTLPVGAVEYRLYRRIDDGPLFLLKQDTGTWDPATVKTTVFDDGMVPPAGKTISYFGQCFDEHGNPGPLALLDQKIGIIPDLPIPVVDSLTSGGTIADPRMLVKASCPSPGVEQMEIKITPDPELTSTLTSTAKTPGVLYNFTPGTEVTAPQTYNTSLVTAGVFKLLPSQPLNYSESVRIKQGVEYTFQIRTLGANGAEGVWSAEQKFTWTTPLVGTAVPWPARPLPRVETWNESITAFLTGVLSYHVSAAPSTLVRPLRMLSPHGGISVPFPSSGGSFPDHKRSQLGVAVEIGQVTLGDADADGAASNWDVYGASQGVSGTIYRYGSLGVTDLPDYVSGNGPVNLWESQLHRKIKMQGDIATYDFDRRLLPIVLYRQQTSRVIEGVNTPVTDADLVQVSPMIENIAWRTVNNHAVLLDPYVRAIRRYPLTGNNLRLAICIFDTAPVTLGATYAYHLVHFGPDGEPDMIHPCGSVLIPITP